MFVGCASNKALVGNWNTIEMVDDGVYQEIAESNIEFYEKGTKLYAGGCAGFNLYHGDIKVKGDKMTFSNLALTKMMGEPRLMDFEDLFLSSFVYVESYSIENDVLTINAPSQKLVMKLKKEN